MIIQCDFDGTITRNNTSVLLRERFATFGWQEIEEDYMKGKFTVEQSNIMQYARIREPREELQEFVIQNVQVRSGFGEFVDFCRERDIRFVVVSSGLDFYIETVLAQIGVSIPELYCAHTDFTDDGIVVSYTDPGGNTIDRGFKVGYLRWLKENGSKISYMGDGLSDFEAARQADYVFATNYLFNSLKAEPVACYRFSDFNDIRRQLTPLL